MAKAENYSYIFIGDLVETEKQLPLKLFDDFYLQRASKLQIKTIKTFIDQYVAVLAFNINKYERMFIEKNKATSQKNLIELDDSYVAIPLDKNAWKYFVIRHNQISASHQIQILFSLSSLDFTVLFEAIGSSSTTYNRLRAMNYFHDDHTKNFLFPNIKTIDEKSIKELRQINQLLKNFKGENYQYIDKALKDFLRIKDISESSPFKVLSCFSILELLLTTNRPKTDSSISNQLQKKINLLNNQFENKIDVQLYFKGSDTTTIETIIEKLYQYRSDIAHGNLSNFEKDLKIFNQQRENILPFLLDLLRKVLIESLKQPQLIADLKEC